MKKGALAVALALAFCAGIAVDYYCLRSVFPTWVRHTPDVNDARTVFQEDTSKKFEGGLENFGIKQGDLITSVNGIKDQTMFQEMMDGYKRGKVCVVYERDKTSRQVCWEKK